MKPKQDSIRTNVAGWLGICVALGFSGVAHAQVFSLAWHSTGGAGGVGAGGRFALSGTLGQSEANPEPLAGGPFSLTGGFWSIEEVQGEEAPEISIGLRGGDVRVSWPRSSGGFVLEQSFAITGTWSEVGLPFTTGETDISVRIRINTPLRTESVYYRLRRP